MTDRQYHLPIDDDSVFVPVRDCHDLNERHHYDFSYRSVRWDEHGNVRDRITEDRCVKCSTIRQTIRRNNGRVYTHYIH